MAQKVTPLFDDPLDPQSNDDGWLTGDTVLQQTGISREALIRLIRLGEIDRSMIRFAPGEDPEGRKRSFFSSAVIGRIDELLAQRDDRTTAEATDHDRRQSAPQTHQPAGQAPRGHRQPQAPEKKTAHFFHLSADAIDATTIFVNREMHIGWINGTGGDRLSAAITQEMAENPSGTVFDVMLRASLKELVFDWQHLFSFVYRFLRETTAVDTFRRLAPTISMPPGTAAGTPSGGDVRPAARLTIDSVPIRIADESDRAIEMRLYGLALAEGSLFMLTPERRPGDTPADSTDADGGGAEADRKTPFSVLSARIDDSRNIVDTLLPEAYFQLMTRIWDESDRIVASFGGQRAKRSGTEVQYILPRQTDRDPSFDAICCAIRLRDRIREIETQLKADGGWFADIRLNIGISSGSDHLQADDLTSSMAFILPGGAADQAFHLSTIAHGGTILITKSAFGHLTAQQMGRITFGIYRDDRLIPKIFARVSELPHAPDTPPLEREIRSLFVTRIIDLTPDDGN